jgi:DNA-binding transcriptional LysR family regulator
MNINCDTLDLRAFSLVMELGNFHRAAEALNLSQPALSRRIKKLEEAVGAKLFERNTRNVTPTAVGRELVPLVRRLLDEFDSSLFSLRDVGVRRGGLISIACIPTAAFYFLPAVIRRFNEKYPDIKFRILDLPANDGLDAVARGEVEFGINMMGASNAELDFLPLVDDPFVLAVRKDHPLAKQEAVRWLDLSPHRVITVHRSSGNRTLLDAALAQSNMKLDWFYEVTHLSTSLGLVEAGLGIAVLPRMATPVGDHPFLVTRPIEGPTVSRTIGVIRRRGLKLSPTAQHFLEMLMNEWVIDQGG